MALNSLGYQNTQTIGSQTWLAVKGKAAAQDAGDLLLDPLFEIPIELVRNATGFRPDKPSSRLMDDSSCSTPSVPR